MQQRGDILFKSNINECFRRVWAENFGYIWGGTIFSKRSVLRFCKIILKRNSINSTLLILYISIFCRRSLECHLNYFQFYLACCVEAVEFLHCQNIIYRDIKPGTKVNKIIIFVYFYKWLLYYLHLLFKHEKISCWIRVATQKSPILDLPRRSSPAGGAFPFAVHPSTWPPKLFSEQATIRLLIFGLLVSYYSNWPR